MRAVITDNPKTPRDEKVRRSPVTPAKEQGSNPAIVRHFKGRRGKEKEENDERRDFIIAKHLSKKKAERNSKSASLFLTKSGEKC